MIVASALVAFGLQGRGFGEGEEVTLPSEEELKAATAIAADVEQEKALKQQEQKIEAEKRAAAAERALGEGNYLVAIEELKAAIAADPENEDYKQTLRATRVFQINEMMQNKKFAEAKDLCDAFLADFPGDAQVLRFQERAVEELAKGAPTPVEKPIPSETQETPAAPPPPTALTFADSARELLAQAEDAIVKKDYQRALEYLDEAHKLNPYDLAIDKRAKQVREQMTRYERAWHIAYREELMTEIYSAWTRRPRRRVLPTEIETPERPSVSEDKMEIMRKLATRIPAVEFEDAKLEEVVRYLSKQAEVNIVIDPAVFTGYRRTPSLLESPTGYPGEIMTPGPTPGPTGIPGAEGTFLGPGGEVLGPGVTTPGITTPGVTPDTGPSTWVPPMQETGIKISLTNVPLSEVLKYVLRYKNLKYVVEDFAIVIVPVDWVPPEALETEIFRLATTGVGIVQRPDLGQGLRPPSETGYDTGTTFGPTMGPSYTDTTTLGGPGEPGGVGSIEQYLRQSGVPWPRGSNIIYNARTGTLIVTNTPTNMVLIRELVSLWDQPALQVEIEARFVELLHTRWFENSFELGMLSPIRFTRDATGGPVPPGARETYEFNLSPNNVSRYFPELLPTEFPTADSSTLLSLTGIMTEPEFQFVWHAIDQTDWSELLSAPRITTISGQQAQIEVIQELTYPTEYDTETINIGGGLGGTTNLISGEVFMVTPGNWETRDVGIILNVTPSVSADGKMITLLLMPEVSDLVKWINYGNEIYPIQQPIFETRNVTTSVHVNDGETIVLGGLITDKTTTYEDKVPFLGSVPFVGRFFRTHAQTSSKANLVVFVTARLITSRGTELAEERAISEAEKKRLEQRLRESKEEAGELSPGVGTTAIVE